MTCVPCVERRFPDWRDVGCDLCDYHARFVLMTPAAAEALEDILDVVVAVGKHKKRGKT